MGFLMSGYRGMHRVSVKLMSIVCVTVILTGMSGIAVGQETTDSNEQSRGPRFPVSEFEFTYAEKEADLPALKKILAEPVTLGKIEDGYVGPEQAEKTEEVDVLHLPSGEDTYFYASGIKAINHQVVKRINQKGFGGIYAMPAEDDINSRSLKDLRSAGDTELTIKVYASRVGEMRTIASGERVQEDEDRINLPRHSQVLAYSPVRPADKEAEKGDLFRRQEVQEYAASVSRHPGRNVEVAVASGQEEGDVVLDYLVAENKPWTVYAQGSNTGTEETDEWRERVGFVHNQLFGFDDQLRLDYVTAGFGDEADAFAVSYEFPIVPRIAPQRLRLKLYYSWNEFTADQVGLAEEEFRGEGSRVGGELTANLFQWDKWFLDALFGLRFQNVETENVTFAPNFVTAGKSDFLLPYAGLSLERNTRAMSTYAEAKVIGNLPERAGTNTENLDSLGRLRTDDNWTALQWDFTQSAYIEPLITGAAERRETGMNLAHELYFDFTGQYTFNDKRLPPQFQEILGGLYSVRGYDESIASGDSAVNATLEYRLHLAQMLPPTDNPSSNNIFGRHFKFLPERPRGRADWDFIIRPFFDIGRTINNGDLQTEVPEQDLMSAGIGVEMQIKNNINIRCDWGTVLDEMKNFRGDTIDGGEEGDNRFHFVATFLW